MMDYMRRSDNGFRNYPWYTKVILNTLPFYRICRVKGQRWLKKLKFLFV